MMSYTDERVIAEAPFIEQEKSTHYPIPSTSHIEKTLGIGRPKTQLRRLRWVLSVVLLLSVAAVVAWWIGTGPSAPIRYQMGEVIRGDLTLTVTATGNLAAVNTVEVGSEISGLVETVYVDFNDRVKLGQLLAALNTDRLQAEVQQSQASLTAAEAAYKQAIATYHEQQLIYGRIQKLAEQEFVSAQDLESSEATLNRAEAAMASAYAQIEVAQANMDIVQTNLGKAEIRSPIDGVVLSRDIEPGQTVAAAFQSPVLFLLAEDLTKMELQVDVDEADVGHVAEGQVATFTVDAYPDSIFPAQITALHYASQTVGGVVTYKAVLSVENETLLLRPGMTATAEIVTQRVDDALLVPNSALRFTPPGYSYDAPPGERVVWTIRGEEPVAITLTAGPSDGLNTVVNAGDLTPGMLLLINVASDNNADGRKGSGAVATVHPPTS